MTISSPAPSKASATALVPEDLLVEAMLLADEARSYFENEGTGDRDRLDPYDRVVFSCEAQKVTTRLLHTIAWVLDQREKGASAQSAMTDARAVAGAPSTPTSSIGALPCRARAIIRSSIEIHRRASHLTAVPVEAAAQISPVHHMHERLKQALTI